MAQSLQGDFRDLFHRGQLTIGISELSKMTGVSPRQLRYWQKKGYIIPKNQDEPGRARIYTLKMVIKAAAMSNLLAAGYTLKAAADQVDERMRPAQTMYHVLFDRYQGSQIGDDGEILIDLGTFDPDPTQELFAKLVDEQPKFILKPKN
ncbi:MerR family transcriptional regulator [Lactiplantibacillus mudanjiangensis]|uniref:MerR family transcriptional regulator [Lactobacillus sp.] n=1 Tax=Lactiplantibacillus mudanjiangensis TaxID=1296538 RepID=A0A660DV78_9LACO|nr:MerR family transcriptional regulator [Lactiplantibacillus mudanjiangensis]VDG20331.1 MerR family transcriptional regulator [Lactobacillus sp.] [Lactiplantibacillus mudanjiangensis]VDG23977.1 MerR family transcriptional regulator [Lactobacillus sp.] [Lactiplantibacillus mudanjiangensis]VDG27161.1 MerR family transcriptional regulator [Lactobacillus sp.] [Lactiplantibacillus mudanjiangensis]VDG33936.1 MerR family transcriptional regulator [Lactobacillus sp.] [Lactiplantibacillus mudanjiangens